MYIVTTEKRDGININILDKDYRLVYPEKIWREYYGSIKDVWLDNAAHILTINLPMVFKRKKFEIIEAKYNTAFPVFKPFFDRVVMKSIPHAAGDYKEPVADVIKRFHNTNYLFDDKVIKKPISRKVFVKKKSRHHICL